MKRNSLLNSIRDSISEDTKREIDLSFEIADRIYELLKKQGKTQRHLATALGKRESEISKWLRGTHNFTTQTIARIEAVLGEPIIEVTGSRKEVEKEYVFVCLPINHSVMIPAEKCSNFDIPVNSNWINALYINEHKGHN